MSHFNKKSSKIYSVGTYLPTQVVKSIDLFESFKSDARYGISTSWMDDEMGICERRMSDGAEKPSSLAINAAKQAIAECTDLNLEHIDMVLFCGIERDQPQPATAHTVQNALGLHAQHVFDVANACFGFVDGIEIASRFIEAGVIRKALITTGEVPTRLIPSFLKQLQGNLSRKEALKLLGWLSVGDAGGAVIMGDGEDERDSAAGFRVFNNQADSSHVDKCTYYKKDDGEYEGKMDMGRIVAHGLKMHRNLLSETLSMVGWDRFDWLISHQTGRRNFDQIEKMNVVGADRMIRTYPLLGNITTATFAISYQQLLNRPEIQRGDRIGGCFSGSGLTAGQFCYTF
ncbi:MAG: 3-oxoacyl-[acyl-carrier-protein] synthase III C-terminal domain-containing protein [Arenicella sp.]|nr:3-oxoacyl-[acyl-carrier-protein] synthase III C-terminal domain-containing protein [Arenicella sp.]